MTETGKTAFYSSHNIHKFNIEITNALFECRIFWARIISSNSESLFTKNTKHSFYEIQYALQGHIGMVIGDGMQTTIPESDFLIVPPNTYHQVVSSDDCGARFIMAFSLECRTDALRKAAEEINALHSYRETPHMRQLLSVILQKNYHDDPLRKESITALVECFLLEVLETINSSFREPHSLRTSTDHERKVADVMSFIYDTGGIGITVSDIANRFRMSQRQLNRLFTTQTGHTLSDAIALEKLRKIEDLIRSTGLSFSEIAEICGFSDGYAMNKFFKRHNRVNLSEFRALAKKEAPKQKTIHNHPKE